MTSLNDFVNNFSIYKDFARIELFSTIDHNRKQYPLVSLHYGNPQAPTLLITGGVHGLERVGAKLALSLLNSFHERLSWDTVLQKMLEDIQVVFIPLVNPVGYFEMTRANGSGVDLMRNAPIESEEKVPSLLGGQLYSNRLPWYRGSALEVETKFVIETVKNILSKTNKLISLDIHSGFGFKDQLWFPFANSHKDFTQLAELHLFFELFKKSHPYHIYKIEPQSKNYLTHGDIWDYCYVHHKKPDQVYLPLSLEMGSWIWVKKNPLQLFSKLGLFNPIKEHRLNRTLRRHRPLFDFMTHSLASSTIWSEVDPRIRENLHQAARKFYYEN
jgi:Zinc carboxypeptidase